MYGARGKRSWWKQVTNCKGRKWNLCVTQLIYIYILKVEGSVLRGSAHCQRPVMISIIQSMFALKDQEFSKNLRDFLSGVVLETL